MNLKLSIRLICLLSAGVGFRVSGGVEKSYSGYKWLGSDGRITSNPQLQRDLLKKLNTPTPDDAAGLDIKGRKGLKNYQVKVAGPGQAPVIPLSEIAYSAENIEKIRAEVRKNSELQRLVKQLSEHVKPWLELSDKQLKALVPAPDAIIAAPTLGDPKVKKTWTRMSGQEFLGRGERSEKVCTIKRPGCIYSPNTKEWYGDEKPGEKYYDSGKGWVSRDGRRFYFKGYWNLWIIIEMHRVMDNLALLYMLTGDELLARRALQILDLLSDLRKKREPDTCYLGIYSKLPKPGKGYLAFNGNHANGRQVLTAISLDLLANSRYATAPSIIDSKLTIFEAARRYYFQVFELGYLDRSLQNHGLVMYGNIATQGALFGYPEAVKQGLDAVFAYFDVCVYRDGDYYETADGYGRIGKRYIYQSIQPFNHYKPSRYENSRLFPQPDNYSCKLKFGDLPIWFNNAVKSQFRMSVYGRNFRFGDTSPDRAWGNSGDGLKKWTDKEKAQFLRIFALQTGNADWREECRRLFDPLRNSPFAMPDEYSIKSYGESQWFYLAPPKQKKMASKNSKSILTPGRLLIALKSGEGKNERAVFSRGGVPTSHGHDDQMGIQLYGRTGCMTGFYGYGRGGTARPDFFGYSVKAPSHQMAIINEDLPPSYIFKKTGTAADVLAFLPVPPAQCFELSNPGMWKRQRGREYRRLVWLIDVNKEDFYMLDIFRLGGGSVHDYIRFAPYLEKPDSNSLKITGVAPARIPGVWSLAGLNPKYRKNVFNLPGKSWGERLQLSGYMKDLGIKSEQKLLRKSTWNPAPGNGYGFIYDVKGANTNNDWLCEWKMPFGLPYKQRLYMLNYDGQLALRAKAPTEKNFHSNYEIVAARRTKGKQKYLRSCFVAVSELAEPQSWTIRKVSKAVVRTGGNPADVVAVWVDLSDGRRDLIISCAKEMAVAVDGVKFSGQRAFVRFEKNGAVECMAMEASSELTVNGLSVKPERAVWRGRVTRIEASDLNNRVYLNHSLPESLSGSTVLFDNKGTVPYTHNEYYKLDKVDKNVLSFGSQSLIGIKLEISKVSPGGGITSKWPMELAGRFNFDYFAGRKITSQDGKHSGIIVRQRSNKDLTVKPDGLFKTGAKAVVWTVKAGDTVSVPSWVLVRSKADSFELKANSPVQVTLPDGKMHNITAEKLCKGSVKIK